MALFSKRNLKYNPYGLTKDDIKGDIEGFPIGVVVRMLEEQELQGNTPNVEIFNEYRKKGQTTGGFDWTRTKDDYDFWSDVIEGENWNKFFEKYPEYERYNLS